MAAVRRYAQKSHAMSAYARVEDNTNRMPSTPSGAFTRPPS
jgi:hypothetical protein